MSTGLGKLQVSSVSIRYIIQHVSNNSITDIDCHVSQIIFLERGNNKVRARDCRVRIDSIALRIVLLVKIL